MAKKKTRRRTGAQPGVDSNEKRRRRLEEKRRQREEAAAAQRRAQTRATIVRGLLVAVLVMGAVWFLFIRTRTPQEIAGHPIENFAETGVGRHTDQPVDYEMSPPVTGEHLASAASCGSYAQPVQNELFVHSLEHGAVGILFDPARVDEETVEGAESLVGAYDSHMISAPFAGMETPITLTSWGEMMRLDSWDAAAAREYIEAFRTRGPEDQPCPNDTSEHFEAEGPNGGNDGTSGGDGGSGHGSQGDGSRAGDGG
jgi:hypothetical protein